MDSTEYVEERQGHAMQAAHHVELKVEQEGRSGVEIQLNKILFGMLLANVDVAGAYSPPRVTQMAQEMGLRVGWGLELTTNDSDGPALEFRSTEMRGRAARRVLRDKPLMLIGSPMCTVYGSTNHINHARMGPERGGIEVPGMQGDTWSLV